MAASARAADVSIVLSADKRGGKAGAHSHGGAGGDVRQVGWLFDAVFAQVVPSGKAAHSLAFSRADGSKKPAAQKQQRADGKTPAAQKQQRAAAPEPEPEPEPAKAAKEEDDDDDDDDESDDDAEASEADSDAAKSAAVSETDDGADNDSDEF
jgi:hypothetical protein